jgi:hypothetical protein
VLQLAESGRTTADTDKAMVLAGQLGADTVFVWRPSDLLTLGFFLVFSLVVGGLAAGPGAWR